MGGIQSKSVLESILGQGSEVRILDSIGYSIAVLDTSLRIVWANQRYQAMHGFEDGVHGKFIYGRHCHEVSFNSRKPCEQCPALRTIKTGLEDKSLGILYENPKQMSYLDVYCFPLKGPGDEVTHVVEVIQDNTEQNRQNRFAKRASLVVPRELRSPFASIVTAAKNILKHSEHGEPTERSAYQIISRAESALAMIDDHLTMSAINANDLNMKAKRINFCSEVVEKVLDHQNAAIAEKGMNARVDVPEELEVICSPKHIRAVYNNLIINIMRCCTAGTEIYLGYFGPQNGFHYFNVASMGDEWIPEDGREKPFEKPMTLRGHGRGIGLYTTREIVRKSGGDIWIEPCYIASGRYIPKRAIMEETAIAEEYLDQLLKANSFVFSVPEKYTIPSDEDSR